MEGLGVSVLGRAPHLSLSSELRRGCGKRDFARREVLKRLRQALLPSSFESSLGNAVHLRSLGPTSAHGRLLPVNDTRWAGQIDASGCSRATQRMVKCYAMAEAVGRMPLPHSCKKLERNANQVLPISAVQVLPRLRDAHSGSVWEFTFFGRDFDQKRP